MVSLMSYFELDNQVFLRYFLCPQKYFLQNIYIQPKYLEYILYLMGKSFIYFRKVITNVTVSILYYIGIIFIFILFFTFFFKANYIPLIKNSSAIVIPPT
jgi:hypothetical protein